MKPSATLWDRIKRPPANPRGICLLGRDEVRYKGDRIRSRGHGFAGMSGKIVIYCGRCRDVGVKCCLSMMLLISQRFARDLLLGSDGINSLVEAYKQSFKPTIDTRLTKFVWLGTTQKLMPYLYF